MERRRTFSREFKLEAVKLVAERGNGPGSGNTKVGGVVTQVSSLN